MNAILSKIIFSVLLLTGSSEICFTQSQEKPKTENKLVAPSFSIVRCDKTTKVAEAEKFCNDGLDLTVQQKFDQAIVAFTRAIELDPKYDDAYNRRGIAYNWKKDNKMAIPDFTKAIELNPKKIQLYLNRGSIYFVEEKNYELAIADFTKAIELDPKNDFFLRMRARIYYSTGRKDLADADWQKAQELENSKK